MSKKYGLILPGSKAATEAPKANFLKPSIFGSDSDSDDQAPKRAIAAGPSLNEKRRARRMQEKALKEDPTIFQYDELYDDIETKRTEEKAKTKESRKPKYINRLLECAERRKLENERRLERVVQKERELEGEEFADKESFVTSAYRKKLEELRKAEEREKREDYLEAIGDVTKQQDLGGFYRHLYEQKLKTKENNEEKKGSSSDGNEPDEYERQQKASPPRKSQSKPTSKPRAYRKRHSSDDEDKDDQTELKDSVAKKAHLQSNLDADSDFSIDDSSTESESDNDGDDNGRAKEIPTSAELIRPADNSIAIKLPSSVAVTSKEAEGSAENGTIKTEIKKEEPSDDDSEKQVKPNLEKKNKGDVWKKRTVGAVFDAALQRYYERKALRTG